MGASSGTDPLLLKALARLNPSLLAGVLWSVILGKPESLSRVARRVTAAMAPQPRIEGLDRVPGRDPFLLVANHFQAPGMWIGWVASAITSAVASVRDPDVREIHWLAAAEWRWLEVGGRWIPNPLTSFFFPRAARTWGMVTMPEDPSSVAGRARGIMQAMTYLGRRGSRRDQPAEPVALFPEGAATVTLGEARQGFGAFACKVSALGVPILPAGVFQDGGVLTVRFGEPFFLESPPCAKGEGLDRWGRTQVMVAIASLVPVELHGRYAAGIAGQLRSGREP